MTGRHDVDFEGVDPVVLTFKYDGTITFDATLEGRSAQAGRAVSLTGQRTVGLAGANAPIKGKLLLVSDDGFCSVQIGGGCSLPGGTGAALTPGRKIVGAQLGGVDGYIKEADPATLAQVAAARHEIVDATDTANVQVLLGV